MLIESLSGIRGLFSSDITEQLVRSYAAAFCTSLAKKTHAGILVGYDTRPQSKQIASWVIEECVRAGVPDVYDCGVASTPAMHLGVGVFHASGGIIITGSSNEPEWNGLKFLRHDGGMLLPSEADALREASKKISLSKTQADMSHVMDVSRRLTQEYVLFLLRTIGDNARKKLEERNLRILVDPDGGTVSTYAKELFDRLHIEVSYKGEQPGIFWRTIEPNAESLAPLLDQLDIEKQDFAIAFDADADQMEIVLPKTSAMAKLYSPFVSGQYVLGLAVKAVLANLHQSNNPVVVLNNATSTLVHEVVESCKGIVKEVDVGEIIVLEKMRETESPIGGEGSSAGVIIPPMPGRDGLLTLAVILRYLAESEKTLDEALLDLPKYATLLANVHIPIDRMATTREKLLTHMRKKGIKTVAFNREGAIKIIPAEKQFMTFRASKTEPGVLRIISDAKNSQDAEALLEEGKSLVKKFSKG